MHHPRRRDRIPALLKACHPLSVRVIIDPEPDGPPSPLRTAKRAWASIAPGATHHVVLQDDILPMTGFAEHLSRALAARPAEGIALSVQQTSPRNSYAVRRAALAGRAFAGMSAVEWTPTLALALPVAQAKALARFLAAHPDEYVDDDQLVTAFRAEHGVSVIATVPNLVQHADVMSLSIHADEGRRPVTVYEEDWNVPPAWWSATGDPPMVSPEQPDGGGLAVELRASRCGLRLLSDQTDEPVEHPFTRDWRDRADLAGVGAGRIAAQWQAALAGVGLDAHTASCLRALSAALTMEMWAAGFLLGADLSRIPGVPKPGVAEADEVGLVPLLRHRTVRSWIEMGLAWRDRRSLAPKDWDALVDLILLAVAAGRRNAAQGPQQRHASSRSADLAGLDAMLRRMARREAAMHLVRPNLATWVIDPITRVSVRPRLCPYCGADVDTVDLVALEPTDEVRVLRPGNPPVPGSVTLHALACEWLTARAMLPLVQDVHDGRSGLPAVVSTRAAAAAEILGREPGASIPDLLFELDKRESWVSATSPQDLIRGHQVLPVSSRLSPDHSGRDTVGSNVFMPHRMDGEPAGLNEAYRRHFDEAYADQMTWPSRLSRAAGPRPGSGRMG
jgi:hypothetical protein